MDPKACNYRYDSFLPCHTCITTITTIYTSFYNKDGVFIGLANFSKYFTTPTLVQSLQNTVWISGATTIISVSIAFVYAYAIARTNVFGKRVFQYVALLPLFAPTMMHGIALTYLFGNQGLVTKGMFGLFEGIQILYMDQ